MLSIMMFVKTTGSTRHPCAKRERSLRALRLEVASTLLEAGEDPRGPWRRWNTSTLSMASGLQCQVCLQLGMPVEGS